MIERASEKPTVSLIVATVGRAQELDRLFRSLVLQSFKRFEVIVVDQNADDRLTTLIECWQRYLSCIHIRSPRGLSRARNAGILLASGTILAFPDDDCWYPGTLLEQMTDWFQRHSEDDFFCCAIRDEQGREVACRWPTHSMTVDRGSVLRACASASFFMRRTAVEHIGGFDEDIGLGSGTRFQSGEDSDLALRCIADGRRGWFEKQLYVHHPYKGAGGIASAARAFAYGMGFGRLLRVHAYSAHALLYYVGRALGGALRSVVLADLTNALFYWESARGRFIGYFASGTSLPGGRTNQKVSIRRAID